MPKINVFCFSFNFLFNSNVYLQNIITCHQSTSKTCQNNKESLIPNYFAQINNSICIITARPFVFSCLIFPKSSLPIQLSSSSIYLARLNKGITLWKLLLLLLPAAWQNRSKRDYLLQFACSNWKNVNNNNVASNGLIRSLIST